MSAVDQLLQNNRRYAEDFAGVDMSASPALRVAVVACMDSRLDVFAALGLARGEAHVIRNAGGVVTDDVLRSLLVSQRMLGTREVMLLHHTGCGLLGVHDEEVLEAVQRETGARPAMALGGFEDVDADVRSGIDAVRRCLYLPAREVVRGFVYDVATGALREVG